MRSETQMMDLILSVATKDDRIRVVGMEGSRANPNAPKDLFQDYDITYLVTQMQPFLQDERWLDVFGKRIMLQKPEQMSLFPPSLGGWFSYLMLFEDGNRIDLKIVPLADLPRYLDWDGRIRILLDKDNRIPQPPVYDGRYDLQPPDANHFDDCCNEFWWVSTYVAKGLCRDEFLYAAEHLGAYVRPSLLRMLSWQTGLSHGFAIDVGKAYKYLPQFLPDKTWQALQQTFAFASNSQLWQALQGCMSLFRQASHAVAQQMGYPYPD
ncbi:aminoglycoside 6-adenylyltransferase, partial [Eubacteriales bacterium OttesenSCG-928-N14]|nr:aminoglycoside 6-adenylyltransferase [Eubacteriales bacterium OttesenSCG-928-N14]